MSSMSRKPKSRLHLDCKGINCRRFPSVKDAKSRSTVLRFLKYSPAIGIYFLTPWQNLSLVTRCEILEPPFNTHIMSRYWFCQVLNYSLGQRLLQPRHSLFTVCWVSKKKTALQHLLWPSILCLQLWSLTLLTYHLSKTIPQHSMSDITNRKGLCPSLNMFFDKPRTLG
jgi:hypothetical protein